MKELPNEDDVAKALTYLADTDIEYATNVARVKALDYQIKTIKALVFLDKEGSVADRTAKSESSQAYRAFVKDYETAVYDKEVVAAKRKRAELTIEVWRSLNSNRRAGM